MRRIIVLAATLACLTSLRTIKAAADQIQLTTILPKLQAIHEDAQTLLLKNGELRETILAGLQAQNEAKLNQEKEALSTPAPGALPVEAQQAQPVTPVPVAAPIPTTPTALSDEIAIDYAEIDEFNRWVDLNLDYAVKNTQATIETLKEEAQQNNGNVEYSDQAIKDGIEGVKYWRSAVLFQDKTLKNEKFELGQ